MCDFMDYKLIIANFIVGYVEEVVCDDEGYYKVEDFNFILNNIINDLGPYESIENFYFQRAIDNRTGIEDLHIAIVEYAYNTSLNMHKITTFPRVWALVSRFVNYFEFEVSYDAFLVMLEYAEELADSVKEGASLHRKTVAKFIVNDAMKKFDNKEDVKNYAYSQAHRIHGFQNDIVIEIKRLIDEEFNFKDNFAEAISKLAFEYMFKYKDVDFNGHLQWIDSKIVLSELLGIFDSDEFRNELIETNSMDLFLYYLKSCINYDDLKKENFISTYGDVLIPNIKIQKSVLLDVLVQTAYSEVTNEHGHFPVQEIKELRNNRVYQMLDQMGLNNEEFNLLFEEYKINEEEKAKNMTIDELLELTSMHRFFED